MINKLKKDEFGSNVFSVKSKGSKGSKESIESKEREKKSVGLDMFEDVEENS